MSIVKMKRLRLIALASEREELLSRLLHVGCVELSEPQVELTDPEWTGLLHRSESDLSDVKQELAQATAALQTLNKYAPSKGGMLRARDVIAEKDFLCGERLKQAQAKVEEINRREREVVSIQNQETRLEGRKMALAPWAPLDVALDIQSTQNVKISFAVCPAGVDMGALMADLAQEAPAAQAIESSTDKEQHYFLWLCHKKEEEAALAALKPYGVSPAGLKDTTGTAAENIAKADAELAQLAEQRAALEAEIAGMGECRGELQVCIDRLRQEVAKEECAQRALTDDTIIFYTGWVSAPELDAAEAELAKFTCAWETEDPTEEEYPEVPIQLRNGKIVRSLNMVTEMYSLPAYNGIDPNPVMAPFFIFFYGFMMADMGYGLLMMLASFIIMKKNNPNGATMRYMIPLLGYCGAATFVMGALTGGFFGDLLPQLAMMINPNTSFTALPALFSPLDDALAVLIGSLAIGLVQIFTGMGISMYKQIKRGEVMAALCNEGAWYAVFILLAVGIIAGQLKICGIAILVILVLTQGYGKKGIVGKLMGIGGSLYNNITGYFSDILSYARLMALMLAGAVIAQVFNTLGAITGNVITFFIIAMIGNALNFALNLLGCYVHDMRLQCLEYFGRFYEDGGKPFRPLAINTQYVDITKE